MAAKWPPASCSDHWVRLQPRSTQDLGALMISPGKIEKPQGVSILSLKRLRPGLLKASW